MTTTDAAAAVVEDNKCHKIAEPHAFHRNLPPQYKDEEDGIPYVTKFAHHKARKIVELAKSIQLTEALFIASSAASAAAASGSDNRGTETGGNKNQENDDDEDESMNLNAEDDDDGVDLLDDDDEESCSSGDGGNNEAAADSAAGAAANDDGEEGGTKPRRERHHHHHHHKHHETLAFFTKKCARLQSQLNGLEAFKYSGISQLELCEIVLHLLKLVTCTIEYCAIDGEEEDNNNPAETKAPATTTTTNGEGGDVEASTAAKTAPSKIRLHYENVGYICRAADDADAAIRGNQAESDGGEEQYGCASNPEQLEEDLKRHFALHSPAREVLLYVLIHILSNKGPLRSVSNSAIYPEGSSNNGDRFLLILHWKPLLKLLLRSAPYLDERRYGNTRSDSNYRESTVLKRSVQLIRDARHFFDQGIRPPSLMRNNENVVKDKTSIELWDMLHKDIMYHSHTHACYRATILLYLFLPTRCSTEYYLSVMPKWYESWTNIDRCPEYDFLWLALFCRARKHISADVYDWGPIRKRLLTHAQYWLQLPIGGAAMDKSFPRVANPRSRSCPSRLKLFTGASSSYEEGIDFVAKVVKLLVTSLGTGKPLQMSTTTSLSNTNNNSDPPLPISEGTVDILRFLSFATPYFNPSNLGSWTFTLGAFLHYFAYELCCRVGASAGADALKQVYPEVTTAAAQAQPGAIVDSIPPHEIVALLDVLLPLCQQAIYSKNGHVGRAGEAAMLYLVQIDPVRATPAFIDFAARALDIQAVNLSHQAPAALSVLTRLVQPALRSDPTVLLLRLPDILRLSLAGIDSNDQNKTIRTLILYRSLTSWLPVGGSPKTWNILPMNDNDNDENRKSNITTGDGTMRIANNLFEIITTKRECPEYLKAVERLPSTSLLKQGQLESQQQDSSPEEIRRLALEEATSALSDWSLEFLDRVFGLLRASGEREKAGKTSSGVANRHSTADVHQARNFSRVFGECLMQLFASMDDEVHELAVRSVVRFIEEETLPAAAKDTSLLCQAVAAARRCNNPATNTGELQLHSSPGLDALITVLTDDYHHHSAKTVIYRVRCLAGSVRYAGGCSVIKHRRAISDAIDFALSSNDRHLFKTGCKLLRHTLSTLSESYPLSTSTKPRVYTTSNNNSGNNTDSLLSSVVLGRSAQLHNDAVEWHVPNLECICFARDLLEKHVLERLNTLVGITSNGETSEATSPSKLLNSADIIPELRRCLRAIRYSLRGGAGILLDEQQQPAATTTNNDDYVVVPHETAGYRLIIDAAAGDNEEVKASLMAVRCRLSSFLIVLMSAIASETLYPDAVALANANNSNATEDGACTSHNPYHKVLPLISSDPKVCKEACDMALLLLTRRGAAFRSQEARTIWKAQKQVTTDFSLCAQVDQMIEILQNADLYGSPSSSNKTGAIILYKDGEDAGKTIPRRLLVARVQLFHNALQRNASFEVPRRLRKLERELKADRNVLFQVKPTLDETVSNLESMLLLSRGTNNCYRPLDAYEGIVDGLFALCCHSNRQVRASAISVIDYAMTRYGWIVPPRVTRMLSGLALSDLTLHGKFGVPSCSILVDKLNHQGKRKRLADAVKGVSSILSLTRAVRQMLGSWKMRLRFVETILGTDHLVSLLPAEEMQKIIHYLQAVFSNFRTSFYVAPRTSIIDEQYHEQCITLVLDILSEKNYKGPATATSAESAEAVSLLGTDNNNNSDDKDNTTNNNDPSSAGSSSEMIKGGAHWRKLLIASWFLLFFVDGDVTKLNPALIERIWSTVFSLLENNIGQPLQRVALGVFGKLISLLRHDSDHISILRMKMSAESSFCGSILGKALVYDHKEDSSIGGGHEAQWSSGVENIMRDAARQIAPRTLFPFQRTSQSMGSFKVPHAQLIEILLSMLEDDSAVVSSSERLLAFAKELAAAPPSEDQRNQQITSAEIFAGVCGSFVRSSRTSHDAWPAFLAYLEDAMTKIPFSLCGAYFDAIRYSLQFSASESFYPLTAWLIEKIQSTLWQPTTTAATTDGDNTPSGTAAVDDTTEENATVAPQNGSPPTATQHGSEGFTVQSKWLYLFSALIIEMDETESDDLISRPAWYNKQLIIQKPNSGGSVTTMDTDMSDEVSSNDSKQRERSWQLVTETLLPRLTEAIGHPFDSCRDHISRCLFRICYSHRKMLRISASTNEPSSLVLPQTDPGLIITQKFASLLQEGGGDVSSSSSTSLPSSSYKDRYNALITARRFISYCVHLGEAKFEYSDYVIPLLPLAFEALNASAEEDIAKEKGSNIDSNSQEDNAARRALEAEVIKGYRFMISEVSVTAVVSYGSAGRGNHDMTRVLDVVETASKHQKWQVRHASVNFLRCFQGGHKFLFQPEHTSRTTAIVTDLLADERREVSSAAMAALTGILAASSAEDVASMVRKYAQIAATSKMKKKTRKNKGATSTTSPSSSTDVAVDEAALEKEKKRARNQQVSVFFLCATIMSQPYDTPAYVPQALAAISKHSFERSAPLGVRDTVKKCCAEYKRTHMSDNWEEHRSMFTREQLEAFEDVVSTPHYYA